LGIKKHFIKEQIIGFLGKAEAGLPIEQLCRRHGFSEASYHLRRSKIGGKRWLLKSLHLARKVIETWAENT